VFPRKNKKKSKSPSYIIPYYISVEYVIIFFVLFPVNSLRETKSYLELNEGGGHEICGSKHLYLLVDSQWIPSSAALLIATSLSVKF
jgi:hypothetical protein